MAESAVLSELKTFQSRVDEKITDTNDKVGRALKRLDTVEELISKPMGIMEGGGRVEQNLSSLVLDSAEFRNLQRAGKGRVTWLLNKSFFPEAFKTVILSSDLGAGGIQAQRVPAIIPPGTEEIRIRDLVPRVATTSGSVDYLREDSYTNAASPQVEGSAKSESAMVFTLETMAVRTLAHSRTGSPPRARCSMTFRNCGTTSTRA